MIAPHCNSSVTIPLALAGRDVVSCKTAVITRPGIRDHGAVFNIAMYD